jgi:hypothetical protein
LLGIAPSFPTKEVRIKPGTVQIEASPVVGTGRRKGAAVGAKSLNETQRFWSEKGTNLSGYTKADCKRIQDTLNRRPRPTLDLDTPADGLAALLDQAAA